MWQRSYIYLTVCYVVIGCLLCALLIQRHKLVLLSQRHQDSLNQLSLLSVMQERRADTVKPPHIHVVQHDSSDLTDCIKTNTTPEFTICLHPHLLDRFISHSLWTTGVWEPYITLLIQRALNHYPKAVFVDIGANIGYYSLLAASMGHRALAVEPQTSNVRRLQSAIVRNNFHHNVTLLHNAVLDIRQTVSLTSNADNQGGVWVQLGRQNELVKQLPTDLDKRERVHTMLMDDILYVTKMYHAVLKIDIEGFECKALMKADTFLGAVHVTYIFMEWQKMFALRDSVTPCPSSAMQALCDKLTILKYTPHEVRTGFQMDPASCATNWRIGDIYWRHMDSEPLQDPY